MGDSIEQAVGVPLATLKDIAELGAKATLAVLGVAYVAGLLITNFSLRQYGLSTFGLARAEYITTGLLWCALSTAGWGCIRIVTWNFTVIRRLLSARQVTHAFVVMLVGIMMTGGLITVPINFLSGYLISGPWTARTWLAAGDMIASPLALIVLFTFAKRAWRSRRAIPVQPTDLPYQNIVLATIFVFGALLLYAEFAYPLFLPVYGGGRFDAVSVILTDDGRKLLAGQNIESTQLYAVVETGEWLAFSSTAPAAAEPFTRKLAIRIRRELIAAVKSGSVGARLTSG